MKFNKTNWKTHPDVITDSLWLIDKRGVGGSGGYPGNFVPEIPYQLIKRYTEVGDTVLDPFAGSGTTIDVATALDRLCIASDLSPTRPDIIMADAAGPSYSEHVKTLVDLVILHPPYSSIIVYSNKSNDLSNPYMDVESFIVKFRKVILNCIEVMKPKAKLAIVIGDMYKQGHVVPLGFMCMQEALDCNISLKAIIVKNLGSTTSAKRNNENLWRYRAMVNGFYIFKHEYVMVMSND